MSAIAASFDLERGGSHPATDVRACLAVMRRRGADCADTWSDSHVMLGVARHAWELPACEPSGIVRRSGRVAIAADATLYYRADLRAKLASHGVHVGAEVGSAELILAAYEAFGADCPKHLEGDFAFLLWDGARGRLFAARDFTGRRTLFHARAGDTLLIASTVGGLLADARVPREMSMTTLATVAAGMWMHSHETGYRAVNELPAGHTLVANIDGDVRIDRYWTPPAEHMRGRESLEDASAQLRELLVRAVDERMSPSGVTAVSLSGGWDSPAVYGAGRIALGRVVGMSAKHPTRGAALPDVRSIRAVSISYPEGDPGREDKIIREIVAGNGCAPEWIDVDNVPMFRDAEVGAARRDEPFGHAYEEWNRELSRGARRVGARVILDGTGGDQLFQVSSVYLTDLLRGGHWLELARQWPTSGGKKGLRQFYRGVVRPALPPALNRLVARARGMKPAPHYLDRNPPFWFRRQFLDEHGVLERDIAERPRLPAASHVIAEAHAFLVFPYFPRIMRQLAGFAVEEGVELRAPLMDERIVRFAVPRPWHERAKGNETKLTLRGAMRGVLPDSVLAPRPHRTGVTSAYFVRQVTGPGRPYFESMLNDSRLADVGMIDPARLRRAWDAMLANPNDTLGALLHSTLQAELWLRGRTT